LAIGARTEPTRALAPSLCARTTDSAGLETRGTPTGGLHASFAAPNLALDVGTGPLPVPIPTIDTAGHVTLDEAGWDATEDLLGAFAQAAGPAWLVELASALGWVRAETSAVTPVRLRLARLVVGPAAPLHQRPGRSRGRAQPVAGRAPGPRARPGGPGPLPRSARARRDTCGGRGRRRRLGQPARSVARAAVAHRRLGAARGVGRARRSAAADPHAAD